MFSRQTMGTVSSLRFYLYTFGCVFLYSMVIASVIIPAAFVSTLSEFNICSPFWDKES